MPVSGDAETPQAILQQAALLWAEGSDAEALALLAAAAAKFPDDGVLATRHADAMQQLKQLGEAAAEYRHALVLDDSQFDAWFGLGCAELARGAYGAAVIGLRRAVALEPERPEVHHNLAKSLFELGEIDAALEHYEIAAGPEWSTLHRDALANIAVIVPGSLCADNAAVLRARRAWAAIEAATAKPAPPRSTTSSSGKLRIGYVSAFFGARNWMKPVWGAINHHDRTRFEIHLFSDGKPPSAESGYADHPLDYIHNVAGAPNDGLADYIARAGIDILVDLNGFSFFNRLGVFASRPAPAIVGWFNTYATTGFDAFDYVVGDSAVIPVAEERFYSERVLRVPGSYLAFSVLYPVPDVTPPPCLSGGPLTFGCFGSQYKITDEVIAAWASILRQAPQARLLVKNGALGDESNRASLRARFAAHGIADDRALLEGPAEHFDFLAAYERVDIALDTFPYNGGTTTMEALWQGAPVLAFDGDRWVSRTSRSLLQAARLSEWCVADRDAYVAEAVRLATSPATPADLASLRSTMRQRLAASPVCDSAMLCRSLERFYRKIAATPQVPRRVRPRG
jgi:protein O-GlcNAc transferase